MAKKTATPRKKKSSEKPTVSSDGSTSAAPEKPPKKPAKKKAVKKAPATTEAPTGTGAEDEGRPIIYPEVVVKKFIGDKALGAQVAKEILGWVELPKDNKTFLFKDRNGMPVSCQNNDRNRPFYPSLASQWMHEILGKPGAPVDDETGRAGNWELNGESLVVGRRGTCLDCQHRLIGLVWAAQEWAKSKQKYPAWKEEPNIECILALGIRERRKTVNTINVGKPRTLADAIYASGLFELDGSRASQRKELKELSQILDYAVRLLWHRVGADVDAYAPRRSHVESFDFIYRHLKLLECVKHIHVENGSDGKIRKRIPLGTAAGLLYLMGCSETEPKKDDGTGYRQRNNPDETSLVWTNWDAACEFWTYLAQNEKRFETYTQTVFNLIQEGKWYDASRTALVVRAWEAYISGMAINEAALRLEFKQDEDTLTWAMIGDTPTVGGIDLGDPTEGDE